MIISWRGGNSGDHTSQKKYQSENGDNFLLHNVLIKNVKVPKTLMNIGAFKYFIFIFENFLSFFKEMSKFFSIKIYKKNKNYLKCKLMRDFLIIVFVFFLSFGAIATAQTDNNTTKTPLSNAADTGDAKNTDQSASFAPDNNKRGILPVPSAEQEELPCLIGKEYKGQRTEAPDGKPLLVMVPNPNIKSIGRKIQCGTVSTGDVVQFSLGLIEKFLYICSAIAVGVIIWSGWQIAYGSITNDKEQGKKTLIYAIMGLIVSYLSVIIVQAIILSFQ